MIREGTNVELDRILGHTSRIDIQACRPYWIAAGLQRYTAMVIVGNHDDC